MALSRPGEEESMSFMRAHGRMMGITRVTITPGSERPGREASEVDAVVQPETIFFDVDVPVFGGDQIEWDDPRGGREAAYVTAAKVYNQGSRSVRHIEVKYSSALPSPSAPASQGGHVIVVNGNNVNIAFDGSTVTQQLPVSAGYETLANAVGRALAIIEETQGVDPDEIDAARDSATAIVAEASRPSPDDKAIKRLLPVLKGVLMSAANAGAGATASGLIAQLFVGA